PTAHWPWSGPSKARPHRRGHILSSSGTPRSEIGVRGRQCGGGSTWITRKGLRPEGWPRPFVIDATRGVFSDNLALSGASKKGVPGYVRLQSAQCANTPSQSRRKTRHTQLWHRHTRIRRAGGLFGGCLRTSWYRTRVRGASQVSNDLHASCQYRP